MVSGADFHAPQITSEKNMNSRLIKLVLRNLLGKYDFVLEDMHSSQLCRKIADEYFYVRLFNHGEFIQNVIQ